MEFRYRESHEPAGLMYGQRAMDSWLYGGDPAEPLSNGKIFDILREKIEQGYFEELLSSFLLDEEHLNSLTVVPSTTMGAERIADEKKRLADIKASSEENVLKYIEQNNALDLFQRLMKNQKIYHYKLKKCSLLKHWSTQRKNQVLYTYSSTSHLQELQSSIYLQLVYLLIYS